MAKKRESLLENFNKTFPCLTDENKSAILDMTKFLVVAQNLVVPAMLNEQAEEDERGRMFRAGDALRVADKECCV